MISVELLPKYLREVVKTKWDSKYPSQKWDTITPESKRGWLCWLGSHVPAPSNAIGTTTSAFGSPVIFDVPTPPCSAIFAPNSKDVKVNMDLTSHIEKGDFIVFGDIHRGRSFKVDKITTNKLTMFNNQLSEDNVTKDNLIISKSSQITKYYYEKEEVYNKKNLTTNKFESFKYKYQVDCDRPLIDDVAVKLSHNSSKVTFSKPLPTSVVPGDFLSFKDALGIGYKYTRGDSKDASGDYTDTHEGMNNLNPPTEGAFSLRIKTIEPDRKSVVLEVPDVNNNFFFYIDKTKNPSEIKVNGTKINYVSTANHLVIYNCSIFTNEMKSANEKLEDHYRYKVISGKMDDWDVSLMCSLLLKSDHELLTVENEIDAVNKIREKRNSSYGHLGNIFVEDEKLISYLHLIQDFSVVFKNSSSTPLRFDYEKDLPDLLKRVSGLTAKEIVEIVRKEREEMLHQENIHRNNLLTSVNTGFGNLTRIIKDIPDPSLPIYNSISNDMITIGKRLDKILKERTASFYGREWLINNLKIELASTVKNKAVVILGEAGIGRINFLTLYEYLNLSFIPFVIFLQVKLLSYVI